MENKYRPEIITLHKYFIWSNRMRTHFDEILQKQDGKEKKENFDIESIMYLSLWYATLNTVIEGWKTLKLEDPKIDALLQSENTNHLKMFRHGVLHYQKDYFDQRFQGMLESNDSVNWVRTLNEEFGRYFLNYYKSLRE